MHEDFRSIWAAIRADWPRITADRFLQVRCALLHRDRLIRNHDAGWVECSCRLGRFPGSYVNGVKIAYNDRRVRPRIGWWSPPLS
jgi:hypothetical protein